MDPKHFPVEHTDDEWKKQLSPAAYTVLRQHGTERAFTSPLNQEKRRGKFLCAGCGEALFSSKDKFESGTGWPSFTAPLPAPWRPTPTRPTGWFVPRCTAPAAAATWATSSRTARAPPASASA